MSNFTRVALAIGAGTLTIGLGACGSTSATTSSSATPTPANGAFGTPSSNASPTPSAAASALALTVEELPSGAPVLAQISDGEMNATANTDQRGFANPGNTYRIEDDVLLDTSSQSAAADYAQLRDAAKSQVTTLSSSSSPTGLGSRGGRIRRHDIVRVQRDRHRLPGGERDRCGAHRRFGRDRRSDLRRSCRAGPGPEDRRRGRLTSIRPAE